jgi:hypothetical protein
VEVAVEQDAEHRRRHRRDAEAEGEAVLLPASFAPAPNEDDSGADDRLKRGANAPASR